MSLIRRVVVAVVVLTAWMPARAQQSNENIYDRHQWERDRANAEGGLHQRYITCEQYADAVEEAFQKGFAHLAARHQTFSPSGRGLDHDNPTNGIGYVNSGAVWQLEREMRTAAEVAYRDMRYVKYDGAETQQCRAIAQNAIDRINQIKSLLP